MSLFGCRLPLAVLPARRERRRTVTPLAADQHLLEAREAALGVLRARFPKLRNEHEDLAQSAVEVLLERRRDDLPVHRPCALARDVAAKRAIDLLRRSSQGDCSLTARGDHPGGDPNPASIVEQRSELAFGLLALEGFPPPWRRLYREVVLEGKRVSTLTERYGVSRRAIQKRIKAMQAAVDAGAPIAGSSGLSRGQLALLRTLATRAADVADERRAEHLRRLVEGDPKLKALVREMRARWVADSRS